MHALNIPLNSYVVVKIEMSQFSIMMSPNKSFKIQKMKKMYFEYKISLENRLVSFIRINYCVKWCEKSIQLLDKVSYSIMQQP